MHTHAHIHTHTVERVQKNVPWIQHLLAISHSTRANEYMSAFLREAKSTVSMSNLSRNSGARYLRSVWGLPLNCDTKLRSSFIASDRSAMQQVPGKSKNDEVRKGICKALSSKQVEVSLMRLYDNNTINVGIILLWRDDAHGVLEAGAKNSSYINISMLNIQTLSRYRRS